MAGVLGIDIDHDVVSAVVADLDTGRPLGVASSSLRLEVGRRGERRQDPTWWWEAVAACTRGFEGLVDVSALAVVGPLGGMVELDGRGQVIGAAISGLDTSATDAALALTADVGGPDAVRAAIGHDLRPGHTAALLFRLRRSDPERYGAAARFCTAHEYVVSRLVGEAVTDAGAASGTGLFSPDRHWSEAVLAAVEPDGGLERRLPPVAPPGVAVGRLAPAAAPALQVTEGTPVAAGTGREMAAAVAMGLFAPRRLGLLLSASGSAFAYSQTAAGDPQGHAEALCDATGAWLPLVSTLNGTRVLHHAARLLHIDLASLENAAAQVG